MEKYAQEYISEDFLKIAKLLAVKHAWDGFVRKIERLKMIIHTIHQFLRRLQPYRLI